jgi:protein-tyrosine-phosphatase
MAQAIFAAEAARRGLRVSVISAGVWDFAGERAAAEAQLACEKHNTPMPKLLATHIDEIDLAGATRVFVMQHSHIRSLLEQTTLSPERISLIGKFDPQHRGVEIDDPIGQDCAAFEQCYQRLRDCIMHYLDTTEDFNQ